MSNRCIATCTPPVLVQQYLTVAPYKTMTCWHWDSVNWWEPASTEKFLHTRRSPASAPVCVCDPSATSTGVQVMRGENGSRGNTKVVSELCKTLHSPTAHRNSYHILMYKAFSFALLTTCCSLLIEHMAHYSDCKLSGRLQCCWISWYETHTDEGQRFYLKNWKGI